MIPDGVTLPALPVFGVCPSSPRSPSPASIVKASRMPWEPVQLNDGSSIPSVAWGSWKMGKGAWMCIRRGRTDRKLTRPPRSASCKRCDSGLRGWIPTRRSARPSHARLHARTSHTGDVPRRHGAGLLEPRRGRRGTASIGIVEVRRLYHDEILWTRRTIHPRGCQRLAPKGKARSRLTTVPSSSTPLSSSYLWIMSTFT